MKYLVKMCVYGSDNLLQLIALGHTSNIYSLTAVYNIFVVFIYLLYKIKIYLLYKINIYLLYKINMYLLF